MMSLRFFSALLSSILGLTLMVSQAVSPAAAQGEGQPSLLQQFGDWGVYAGVSSGKKVCFALAQPASAETVPPKRPRDPVYFFISTRPAENVRNEVSIIMGYPHKPGADASAEIGSTRFALQTRADNVWVKNTGEEERLLDAMRRGSDVVVKGVSGRGTQTIDRYSLRGLSQALDRVVQECR